MNQKKVSLTQVSVSLLGLAVLLGTALPQSAESASYSATITSVLGEVQAKTGASWLNAAPNVGLPGGASVRTGSKSRTDIRYSNGSVVRLGSRTLLRIREQELRLLKGKTFIQKEKNGKQMKVRTPTATATVLGTDLFVSHNDQETSHVTTLNGEVEVMVNQTGEKAIVHSGEWVEIEANKPLEQPTKFDWDKLKKNERFLLDSNFVPKTDADFGENPDWK